MVDTLIEESSERKLMFKDEAAKKWLWLRQNVLILPKEDVVNDIQNKSEISPQDLTEIKAPEWNPKVVAREEDGRKMVILCETERGSSILGVESLKAGLNFAIKDEKTSVYTIPYPEFTEKGDYVEKNSFLVKLNTEQFNKVKNLVEKRVVEKSVVDYSNPITGRI